MEYGGFAEEELQADERELRTVRAEMLSVFLTAPLGGIFKRKPRSFLGSHGC